MRAGGGGWSIGVIKGLENMTYRKITKTIVVTQEQIMINLYFVENFQHVTAFFRT